MKRLTSILLMPLILWLAPGCKTTYREGLRPVRAADTPSIWPVQNPGAITSPFGPRQDPTTKKMRQHNGLDIRVPKHTPVLATADGVVTFAGYNSGYGRIIKLLHAHAIETWYAHLDRICVKEGKQVRQATVIGEAGDSGNATGPHLHYEVHVNGVPVDPSAYVR